MLVYVAGPYSEYDKKHPISENVAQAYDIAAELWIKGFAVICPHMNTLRLDEKCSEKKACITYEMVMRGDLDMVSRCDALVMTPDWEKSPGATQEYNYAQSLGIPIYVYPNLPEISRTELNSPIQVQAFREIIGKMYRLHIAKNCDYSPANILGTGEIGLATRLWDKMARLLNLVGFNLKVQLGTYEKSRNPKNESLDETYFDLAVYAIIGLLLRHDQWGK
jgi:nucleoside 2-deoxyribosyltransferase